MEYIKKKIIKEFKEKDFEQFGFFWGIYNYDLGKCFIRKANVRKKREKILHKREKQINGNFNKKVKSNNEKFTQQ